MPHVRYAVQMLAARVDEIESSDVKSVCKVSVPAYSVVSVAARVHSQQSEKAVLIQSVEGVPMVDGIVHLKDGENFINVEIANYSGKDIVIKKNQKIAISQQVSLVKEAHANVADKNEFLESFKFDHLPEEEADILRSFLLEHRQIFAMNSQEMGCTSNIMHKIELLD